MKSLFYILAFVALFSCASTPESKNLSSDSKGIFVADFDDFGFSMYSLDLLGYKRWSWLRTGGHLPKEYDIKVIVYKDRKLEMVKQSFPIIPEKEQDYRYVDYQSASNYFAQTIESIESDLDEEVSYEDQCSAQSILIPVLNTAYKLEKKLGE